VNPFRNGGERNWLARS